MLRIATFIAASVAFFTNQALADDAVVPPLVAGYVSPKDNVRLSRLIASEVEYLDIFDSVEELEYKTTKITSKCLTSVSCLYKFAKSNEANAVVAGKVTRKGKTLYFELRYILKGKLIRKHNYLISQSHQ